MVESVMKQRYSVYWFFVIFLITVPAYAQYPGQFESKLKVDLKVPVKAYAFDLSEIRLLDSRFKQAMELDQQWLMSLDTDRLLHNYRVNAGIQSNAEPLGGWEELDVELRGHSVGHILSALAMMYQSTGDPAFKTKGDSLVAGLAEVQKVLGKSGYLSAFPEHYIDRVIERKPVWAPWYTLHKIYAGLLDMYLRTDNQQALDVAQKMGLWAYNKLSPLSHEQMQAMLETEFGGMNEVMYNLYAATGNEKFRELAERFYHEAVLNPLSQETDDLQGLHANTQIPKVIGTARGFELTGAIKDQKVSEFFWQTVINNHTYAIGGNSDGEHFGPPGELADRLSSNTTETCNTYNMLKLTSHLFTWHASAKYADYYERALYNHILASQNPNTGMVCYYVSLHPGGAKNYSTRTNSFWCCVGTGFENHAKYGETIYYKSADQNGLYVNLFIPSVLNWKEKNITVRQETAYPEEPNTTLTIKAPQPVSMPVMIRYPSWSNGIDVSVNGSKIPVKTKPGNYVKIQRKWNNGDTIQVHFNMDFYTDAMPDDKAEAAILYGPLVMAGDLGSKEPETHYNIPAILASQQSINKWIEPAGDKDSLVFKTDDAARPNDVTLRPFYKISNDHYTVYWNFLTQPEWKNRQEKYAAYKAEQADIANRTIDTVDVGNSDSEKAHQFHGENTYSRDYNNRYWRSARNNGWFEYRMKTPQNQAAELRCSYWGNEEAAGFSLLVGGKTVPAKSQPSATDERLKDMIFTISQELTSGKSSITARFQANQSGNINGIIECRMLKAKE